MSASWGNGEGGLSFDQPMATSCTPLGGTIAPLQPYNPTPSSSFTQSTAPILQSDMPINARTFHIQGPFSWSISLATSIPGRLALSFAGRARSEPLVNTNNDMDVDIDRRLSRSRSEYHVDIPMGRPMQEPIHSESSSQSTPMQSQLLASQSQPQPTPTSEEDSQTEDSQIRRAPSLAPTEIEDPEHEDVLIDLQARGIKVKDFAFLPWQPNATPAFEIFDQFRAIVEYDYRLSQNPRVQPIPGKVVRRLIDMGWLDEGEVRESVAQMDLDELERHNRTKPLHPWRPYPWTNPPTMEQRKMLLASHAMSFKTGDRYRVRAGWEAESEEKAMREGAIMAAALHMEEREQWEAEGCIGEPPEMIKGKRPSDLDPELVRECRERFQKKRKISPPRKNAIAGPSNYATAAPIHVPAKQYPAKQYPAVRSQYDPAIYDAADIIKSQVAYHGSTHDYVPPPRQDTPPLSEDEDAYENEPPNSLRREKRKKKMNQALSRTLTYKQF